MRTFALVAVAVCLALTAAPAQAGGKRSTRRVALATTSKPSANKPKRDRSVGSPSAGHLQSTARLRAGTGYHIRRPARTYGTRTTVQLVRQAIADTRRAYPKIHVLAIGDLSQEHGGSISQHASHQSGRDVDVGLFYRKRPAGYPDNFVRATKTNLDAAATWKLVYNFAHTQDEDGGAQYIFLDHELQQVLYTWAEAHRVSAKRIHEVQRVLRHWPNHHDHIHVRFKCRERDTACR